MTRPVAVLRPEPGNAATAAHAEAFGLTTIALPLFAIRPLAWSPVDAAAHDALLVTSANAIRHGGDGLKALRGLPVFAVGAASAAEVTAAGLTVMASGDNDAAEILAIARAEGFGRLLHLGGRERSIGAVDIVAATVAVYASEPLPVSKAALQRLSGCVALLHSARAAAWLSESLDAASIARDRVRIAALSEAVRTAAGTGWAAVAVAATPTDNALLAAARTLAD